MNKRGQLTIFIIIAILIVAGVALFFVFRGNVGEESSGSVEVQNVVNFIDACLEDSSKNALYFIGLHGGYSNIPEESNNVGVPYYLSGKSSNIPSKILIENEISEFMEKFIPLCVGSLEGLEEFEVEILGEPNVKTLIKQEDILFDLNYPIRITKGESSSIVEDFDTISYIRLEVLYETSKFIVDDHIRNFGDLCVSCLLAYGRENQVDINMKDDGNAIVYELGDELSLLPFEGEEFEDENYKFKFAVKYG